MSCNITLTYRTILCIIFCSLATSMAIWGQEENPPARSNSTYHNQLFFNRFLINPTFSLVRENKSYINLLHRNQYAAFEDNSQNYFLGFSNKLNENTALGISVYSQWMGVVQEFGFNANYARSVRLGDKSRLSFGANVTYFNEGLDKNRVVTTQSDELVDEAGKESKLAIQPGITLSLGKFDLGLYATDLLRYNQTTNNFLTSLNSNSVKASLQYTHSFGSQRGLFTDARLMPLVQLGENVEGGMDYIASLLLDLPKYGWLQTNFNNQYGLSMGLGVNLNKKMSLGYLMEKDITQQNADLGWNHEVSLAYTFQERTTSFSGLVDSSEDHKIDGIVRNYEEQILRLKEENRQLAEKTKKDKRNKAIPKEGFIAKEEGMEHREDTDEVHSLAYENRLILDELIMRQDSIEAARTASFERRFENIVRALRNDIKNSLRANIPNNENTHKNRVLVAQAKTSTKPTKVKDDPIQKNYEKLPIKVLNEADIIGVKPGYYVIANVYKNKKYLNAFMDSLKEKGLVAKQFYNKKNGLYYVYLADYNFKDEAKIAFSSNLDGKYEKEKWIMEVADNSAIVQNTYLD